MKKLTLAFLAFASFVCAEVIPPEPSVEGGITAKWIEQETLQGGRIAEFSATDSDVWSHQNSGGWSAFSADGKWLSVFKVDPGIWYAANVETLELVELMPRTDRGWTNTNVVWSPTGSQYFRLRDRRLERWRVGGTKPLVSVPIPAYLRHYAGTPATSLGYRLQVGSGRQLPALYIYDSKLDEHAVMPFKPDTLELLPHWWVREALERGVTNGTCTEAIAKALDNNTPASKRSHNMVTMGEGYAFAPQADMARPVYVPRDGSTAIVIEEPPNGMGNRKTHPAYRGWLELVGDPGTGSGLTMINSWAWTDNKRNLVSTEIARVDKAELLPSFPGQTNRNAIAYHHGDIGNEYGIASMIDWSTPIEAMATVLFKIRISDGKATAVVDGLTQDLSPTHSFYESMRPSISVTDRHAQYVVSKDGRISSYLCELRLNATGLE